MYHSLEAVVLVELHELLNTASLKVLPKQPRQVEGGRDQEQHEGDPLVPGMRDAGIGSSIVLHTDTLLDDRAPGLL